MNANQLYRTAVPRRIQVHALGLGGVVVAVGLFIAGPTAAQQSQAASPRQQSVAEANRRQAANDLSPATIRMLQHSLIQGGYAVDATDGVWGPKTAAGVREFQRVKGLQPTGRADPQTLAALGVTADGATHSPMQRQPGAGTGSGKPPQVQARTPADLDRATIRAIQQALDKQGLQVGPVDGVWGEQTTSAIGNFQRARGMTASGEPNAHTLAALGLLPGGSERAATMRSGQSPGPADLDPAAIRMIQQSLSRHGFEVRAADGIWGDRTVSALRDFQRAQGIEPLGEPDVHTLAALGLLPRNETTPTARRQPR